MYIKITYEYYSIIYDFNSNIILKNKKTLEHK